MGSITAPVSIDLSHHFNSHAQARHRSPLKDIVQFMFQDGIISLAGGLPNASLFPYQEASFSVYPSTTDFTSPDPSPSPAALQHFTITNAASPKQPVAFSKSLQYGTGHGVPSLLQWAHDFTSLVFTPGYADFKVLTHMGNTDAWCKVLRLLCEPGEVILCEEFTYPSAQALWIPMGCRAAPVRMDERGIVPEVMEAVLAGWEGKWPGVKRPHVLYVVPVGSNPAGITMDGERRKKIYDICVKYDIIICEDDPYSFLQYSTFDLTSPPSEVSSTTPEEFLASLVPSFLKFDYQGRVIRLDTFSKTLAPGSRLGYFVANPIFIERLLRATEVETCSPSGWSQAITMSLLSTWGTNGYITWLSNLRNIYQLRRDWMCSSIAKTFTLQPHPTSPSLTAYTKTSPPLALFSFVPPTGGMFIWAKFFFAGSKRFASMGGEDAEAMFEKVFWEEMVKEGVLLSPGSYFMPIEGPHIVTVGEETERGTGYMRLAFSMTTKEEMESAILRMAKAIETCWEL